jgi:hypothetical protein
MRRGSVPLFVHGLVEYGLGALSILAPILFSFDSDGATVVCVVIGTGILVLGILTQSSTGIVRTLPLDSHIVLDYVIALAMIVMPFVLGFTDDEAALAYFVVAGIVYLLMTVMTRYRKSEGPDPHG